MEFLDFLAKRIQIAKDVLDLNDDLESPSLISQFAAVKHQLDEVQRQLDESHRISHEKDLLISKLQRAVTAQAQSRPSTPAFMRHDEASAPATPVRAREAAVPVLARHAPVNRPQAPTQTDPDEEIKLPGAPSYEAAAQEARAAHTDAVAETIPVQAPTAAPAKPEKAKPVGTRVTDRVIPTAAEPKETAEATKSATTTKAESTPTRAVTKQTTAATKPEKKTTTATAAAAEPKETAKAAHTDAAAETTPVQAPTAAPAKAKKAKSTRARAVTKQTAAATKPEEKPTTVTTAAAKSKKTAKAKTAATSRRTTRSKKR